MTKRIGPVFVPDVIFAVPNIPRRDSSNKEEDIEQMRPFTTSSLASAKKSLRRSITDKSPCSRARWVDTTMQFDSASSLLPFFGRGLACAYPLRLSSAGWTWDWVDPAHIRVLEPSR